MKRKAYALTMMLCVLVTAKGLAEEPKPETSFKALFNGKNLDGWVRVNTAESTWSVRDGMLVCSGKPIGELRTTRMYQNFILELEWRHMKPRGNAGVFVWADDITWRGVPFHRSIEIQVLENAYGNTRGYTTHGDIFPIHGAKMTPINGRGGNRAFPIENRSNASPEWNHYRIECRDGNVSLAVNGKVVTRGKDCSPRKGYICIESEGGIVHYRNMKLRELPDTPVAKEHIAISDRGYQSLYNGIDLDDWTAEGDWKPSDWTLKASSAGSIETVRPCKTRGVIFDVRYDKVAHPLKLRAGKTVIAIDPAEPAIKEALQKPGKWNRFEADLAGGKATLLLNGKAIRNMPSTTSGDGTIAIETAGSLDIANIYFRSE